jgi:hypothetical protein
MCPKKKRAHLLYVNTGSDRAGYTALKVLLADAAQLTDCDCHIRMSLKLSLKIKH